VSGFSRTGALVAAAIVAALPALHGAGMQDTVFKAGVDLVQVAVVVTDGDGRFIKGLSKDDFIVSDNGKPQEIVAFSGERVPVSLGMLLDVSGSMTDEALATARSAIEHFVSNLLGREDELFLMEFAARGRMLQAWTRNRDAFRQALARAKQVPLHPAEEAQPRPSSPIRNVGTAVFDAIATSLTFAAQGVHQKKAVLVISDGRDTASRRSRGEVQDAIRNSDVLVYALAVDGGPSISRIGPVYGGVDATSLRRLTDDTGGRTEVVNGFRNLAQATARLADELNQQYVIGYAGPANRDRRWHAIKVEVRKKGAKVRARTGYVAR